MVLGVDGRGEGGRGCCACAYRARATTSCRAVRSQPAGRAGEGRGRAGEGEARSFLARFGRCQIRKVVAATRLRRPRVTPHGPRREGAARRQYIGIVGKVVGNTLH